MAGKLVIIGGGSAYTPDIIAGLLTEPEVFTGWEWVLHDVDEAHVRIIAGLARQMCRAAAADVRVRYALDRTDALGGAHFVLTQPRPGGLRHRVLDEKIPLRLGVIGQETLGPGGFAFAWRSVPVMLDVVAQVLRLAPDAWVISYTNPAGMVTEAVTRQYPAARFIGLCDMPTGLLQAVAKVLHIEARRLQMDYRGLNHGGWVDQVLLDGARDVLPRLARLARWIPARLLPLQEWTGVARLLRDHGRLADPYLRYYYFTTEALARLRAGRHTRAEVVMGRLTALYNHYRAEACRPQPRLRLHRGHASHRDLAAGLIRSLAAGRRERWIIQQRNPGHLQGLPAGRAAQFPVLLGPDGWEPLPVPALPEPAGVLLRQIQAAECRNVDAILAGDRQMATEAMAMNPLVPDRRLAERLVTELLKAHRGYLPTFDRTFGG